MISSKYPRDGEGIAPVLLSEVLRSAVPESFKLGDRKLSQLDRQIWTQTDVDAVDRLSRLVIADNSS